jgi:hypothetical protein
MHYNTLNAALAAVECAEEIDPLSLYHVFEQLTEGRHPRGKRYSLALVLSLLIVGKLAGMTTLTAKALVGALARGLAAPGAARYAGAVSLPGDVQQRVAHCGCHPGDAPACQLADAARGRPSLWHRTQSIAESASRTGAARPAGP